MMPTYPNTVMSRVMFDYMPHLKTSMETRADWEYAGPLYEDIHDIVLMQGGAQSLFPDPPNLERFLDNPTSKLKQYTGATGGIPSKPTFNQSEEARWDKEQEDSDERLVTVSKTDTKDLVNSNIGYEGIDPYAPIDLEKETKDNPLPAESETLLRLRQQSNVNSANAANKYFSGPNAQAYKRGS